MSKGSILLKSLNRLNLPPTYDDTTSSSNLGESQVLKVVADPFAVTSSNAGFGVSGKKSLLVISKKAKRITLLRYLLSKVVYEEKKIAVRDILAIFQCLLDCQDLAGSNTQFQEKFGFALEALTRILKGIKFTTVDQKALTSLRRAILKIPEGFIYPQRNLPQLRSKVEGSYMLTIWKQAGIPNRQLPPKLYVGKGYSDKGTARNLALDGSPRWQDVASKEVVK